MMTTLAQQTNRTVAALTQVAQDFPDDGFHQRIAAAVRDLIRLGKGDFEYRLGTPKGTMWCGPTGETIWHCP